jgi:uncharacterized protein (DUF952 family)
MPGMRIFHIATVADWKQAEESGTYTTSTYGRTLAEEGYIHAARHDQVPLVRDRYYADVADPLLVLEIETDLLDSPWREDDVEGEAYPHIYGPLNPSAVVRWRPARLPPIEPLSSSSDRPPAPEVVNAFYGLTLVLGVIAVALASAGLIADAQVHSAPPTLPRAAEFLVWSLAAAAGVGAVAAYAVAWVLRRQSDERSAPS